MIAVTGFTGLMVAILSAVVAVCAIALCDMAGGK